MNLSLVSTSNVKNNDCFVLDYIFDGNLLTNDDYHGLVILDFNLNPIKAFNIDDELIGINYYFSEDRKHFLLYCGESSSLYYINLTEQSFNPIKLHIPRKLHLTRYYLWHKDKFIIIDYEGKLFSFDLETYRFEQVDELKEQEVTTLLQPTFNYLKDYRILFFNIEKGIFVYRERTDTNKIYWKNSLRKIDFQIQVSLEDICMAGCVDDLLMLVNDENIIFYQLDNAVYQLPVRDNYRFFSARLYKHEETYYFLTLSFHMQDYKDTIIDLYKVY